MEPSAPRPATSSRPGFSRVGDVLAGKYRLDELLGSGGMGDVYRAENTHVGRTVAIKLLRFEHAENQQVRDRFMREARAANLVRHPNVVDVLDVGQDADGSPFIVQELLTGEDLHKYTTRLGGSLSLEDVVDLCCPVIDAVAEAHAKGVVHRDIKPENVFLVKSGTARIPKLLDFGISKVRSPDVRATDAGVMLGTPAYMAPEQLQGARDADARTDVWAIGVMLFELLSGRLPFDAKDAPSLFVAIATTDAPTLLEVAPHVAPTVSRIVARCLRRKPDERYPSASELARDLRHLLEGTEIEPTNRRSIPPSMAALVPDLLLPNAPSVPKLNALLGAPSSGPGGGAEEPAPDSADRNPPAGRRAPDLAEIMALPVKEPATPKAIPKAPSLMPGPSTVVSAGSERKLPAAAPAPPPAPSSKARAAPPGPAPSGQARAAAPAAAAASAPARPPPAPPRSSPVIASVATDPRSHRLANDAQLPGVMLGSGPSSKAPRATAKGWGVTRDLGTDVSWIVGGAVVGLVSLIAVGVLMQMAHRPEGWPVLAFLIHPTASMNSVGQSAFALVAAAIGLSYLRRGVKHWQGELAGGPPGAVISALIAAAAIFAAVELASAGF